MLCNLLAGLTKGGGSSLGVTLGLDMKVLLDNEIKNTEFCSITYIRKMEECKGGLMTHKFFVFFRREGWSNRSISTCAFLENLAHKFSITISSTNLFGKKRDECNFK